MAQQITKEINQDGVHIVVRRRTYGDRKAYMSMMRRFVPDLPDSATLDEQDDANSRNYLVIIAAQTIVHGGIDIHLPNPTSTQEEFDNALAHLYEVDDDLVIKWVEAINQVQHGDTDPDIRPLDTLTEEQRNDPN